MLISFPFYLPLFFLLPCISITFNLPLVIFAYFLGVFFVFFSYFILIFFCYVTVSVCVFDLSVCARLYTVWCFNSPSNSNYSLIWIINSLCSRERVIHYIMCNFCACHFLQTRPTKLKRISSCCLDIVFYGESIQFEDF